MGREREAKKNQWEKKGKSKNLITYINLRVSWWVRQLYMCIYTYITKKKKFLDENQSCRTIAKCMHVNWQEIEIFYWWVHKQANQKSSLTTKLNCDDDDQHCDRW